MKTTAVFVTLFALLSAGIDSVSAACYGSGAIWADVPAARWHAERACSGYDGRQGALQGVFAPGEIKRACIQYNSRQRFDFSVRNLNTVAAIDLADYDCTVRLQNEINGCEHGGLSVISGWEFIADPNDGNC